MNAPSMKIEVQRSGSGNEEALKRSVALASIRSCVEFAPNKAVKPFACGSLGRSVLRACSGMASPFLPDQSLRTERRLPGR